MKVPICMGCFDRFRFHENLIGSLDDRGRPNFRRHDRACKQIYCSDCDAYADDAPAVHAPACKTRRRKMKVNHAP